MTNLLPIAFAVALHTNIWWFGCTARNSIGLEGAVNQVVGCTNNSDSVRLTWNPVVGAVGYFIYYGTNQSSLNNQVDAGNTTNYLVQVIKPLTNGWDYFWDGAATLTGPWIQQGQLGHFTNGGTATPPAFTRVRAIPWHL